MLYIPNLLDAAKSRHNLKSDYALAHELGVKQSTVSRWRKGERLPEYAHCVALAVLAGLEAENVIVAVAQLRDKGQGKKVWQRVATTTLQTPPHPQRRLPLTQSSKKP